MLPECEQQQTHIIKRTAKSEEHRKIIQEYAAKGYRYVGFIPTELSDAGKIKCMDLVFELDK